MGTTDLTFRKFSILAAAKGRNRYSSKKKAALAAFTMLRKDFKQAFLIIRDSKLFLLDEFWEEDFVDVTQSISPEKQWHIIALRRFYQIHSSLRTSIRNLSTPFKKDKISSIEVFVHACKVFEIAKFSHGYPKLIQEAEKAPQSRRLFYAYDHLSAPAIHIISKKLKEHESGKPIRTMDHDLMIELDRWIQLEKDKMLLDEMIDTYFYGEFTLELEETGSPFSTILKPKNEQVAQRIKRNEIKENFRRAHYKYLSQDGISDDSFFKEIDPFFKTTEGVAAVISSGLKFTSQTKGTTSLEVGPDFFDKDNPQKSGLKAMGLMLESQFNFQLRLHAQNNFWLSDESDTSKLQLPLPNGKTIPLSKMILALSAFAAEVPNIQYTQQYTSLDWLTLGKEVMKVKGVEKVDLDILQEIQLTLSTIDISQLPTAQSYPLMQSHAKDKENMIGWLQEITKLSSEEVEGMLALLVEQQYGLSPFHFHNNIYYWYPYDFTAHLIPTYFYDYYWKMSQFSHKKGNKNSVKNADNRAILVADYLARVFKEAGYSYVKPEASFIQIDDPSKPRGIDLLVYDERSNAVLSIEIKLSNTPQDSYFKKNRWTTDRIEKKALEQVKCNDNRLTHPEAGEWLQEQLGLESPPKEFSIHHLIATDNFFFDHEWFTYGQSEDQQVQVVSIFELQKILRNNDLVEPESELWIRNEILRIDYENRIDIPETYLKWAKCLEQINFNIQKGQEQFQQMVSFVQDNKVEFWDHETRISIPRLMEVIQNNLLWQFFEEDLVSYEIKKELKMIGSDTLKMRI